MVPPNGALRWRPCHHAVHGPSAPVRHPPTPAVIWRFGSNELDTDAYELRHDGHVAALEPQVFDVLVYLLSHRDRVVSKEELLDEIWGDRFVSESSLTSRIKDARRAVGDDGKQQSIIRTVHGRGYRFVGKLSQPASARHGTGLSAPLGLAAPPTPARTRYTKSSGYEIAYQVLGDGPDLVFIPGFVSNLDLQWEHPAMAAFFGRLASFSRLILFDKRGTGVSERVPVDRLPTLEERMDDVRAVLDAAGSRRATLFGISEGGPMSLLLAAAHPERVERLALYGSFTAEPFANPERFTRLARRLWGRGQAFLGLAPSWARDEANATFLARFERQSATPDAAAALVELASEIDPRPTLSSISVPTLVLHRRDDDIIPFDRAEIVTEGIAGAELVALDGVDHLAFVDSDPILDHIERFVTGSASGRPSERILTTMLFVDVVSSTSQAAEVDVGDARWRTLLAELFDRAAHELIRTGGTLVHTTGDGLLAIFDGPARAVRCGLALVADLAPLGVTIRCGVHTSEVERLGDDIAGIGVHVGSRVEGLAQPGEVLVTRTVRDLVAGSGLRFEPRGDHELRGLPDSWDLYAATA